MLRWDEHANVRRTEELALRERGGEEPLLPAVAFHHGLLSVPWQKAPRATISSSYIANFPRHISC